MGSICYGKHKVNDVTWFRITRDGKLTYSSISHGIGNIALIGRNPTKIKMTGYIYIRVFNCCKNIFLKGTISAGKYISKDYDSCLLDTLMKNWSKSDLFTKRILRLSGSFTDVSIDIDENMLISVCGGVGYLNSNGNVYMEDRKKY